MLSTLALFPALPAFDVHKVGGAVLEPEADGRSIKSLGTSRPLKVALKRQTVMVAKEDCQCWLWSDPHVETCDGTVADFNPMPEPVHTVAATPDGAFNMQSYAAASAAPLASPPPTHVSDARLPAARASLRCAADGLPSGMLPTAGGGMETPAAAGR